MAHCCIAGESFNTHKDGESLSLARLSPICQALDEHREKHLPSLRIKLDLAALILLKTTLKCKQQ